jgi:hypothetical protein
MAVNTKKAIGFSIFLACLAAAVTAAFAHSGGAMPKPFLQRHAVMTSLAAHLKAAKADLDAKDWKGVALHAEAIHWLARIVPDTFPKGSGPEMGKTRASPKIWKTGTASPRRRTRSPKRQPASKPPPARMTPLPWIMPSAPSAGRAAAAATSRSGRRNPDDAG